jgi:hypothetical protein
MHENKETLPVKTPNLVQKQTGTYKYPALVLPVMNNLTKTTVSPSLPSRINQAPPAAPIIGSQTPARPLGPMTNTPNQARK